MSHQMIYADSHNATSSPVSECGHLPCAVQDGRMINQSGQEVVRASLSARQAKEMGLLTSGTFGLHSSTSSASASLALSLVNRLQVKTASDGSTLFKLIWKQRTTPSARSIYALRASVRRISDSDYSGWPTPTTRDWKDGKECQNVPLNSLLGRVTWMAGWGDSKHEGLNPNPLTESISQSKNKGWMLKPKRPDARGNVLQNSGPTNGYWRDADWLFCRDEKWRPVEPGTFPLADGIAGRVGKLRAYGNAIVAPVAEEFIRAYMLITEE